MNIVNVINLIGLQISKSICKDIQYLAQRYGVLQFCFYVLKDAGFN